MAHALLDNGAGSRPIRICGVSGSALDRRHGFKAALATDEQIDMITGDWLSEGNMASTARIKSKLQAQQQEYGYEASFLQSIEPVLGIIARKKIKVVVNAGASDTEVLSLKMKELLESKGIALKVAWISGDEVLYIVQEHLSVGRDGLTDLETGEQVKQLPDAPIYAQAYLGGRGIAQALHDGADIVICGRVADASPTIGAALWWHGWQDTQYNELANALVAGHLIECSTYVTGGNFSGFKNVPGILDLGFPIAEIGRQGEVTITKISLSGGEVTENTVAAQLLYEIQGPWYYNSDVTAVLDNARLRKVGKDRIAVDGITGLPPPPTTKVGITFQGGYAAELHWSIVGLDIEAKARLLEQNIRDSLGLEQLAKLSTIQFTTYGVSGTDPSSQAQATVDFRVFVQARDVDVLSSSKWIEPVLNVIMCSHPGATMHPATTAGIPRQYSEYRVYLIPQSSLRHQVHFDDLTTNIPPPAVTRSFPPQQQSYDPDSPVDLKSFGPTKRGPIGWIVHARSGDKGANANVGFWARSDEEYQWLRSLLTISKVKELLGDEYKPDEKVDRFELPGLRGVHFLLQNHLDRGVNSTGSYDILGKNVGEFLRARHVDLPVKFLEARDIL